MSPKQPTQTETAQAQIVLRPLGLSIEDAALYIGGVTPAFIERMIRSGKLPARRMSRGYTVAVSDLDAFFDAQPIVNPAQFAAPPDDGRRWRRGKNRRAA